MDSFNNWLQRYHEELVKIVCGSTLVIYIIWSKFSELNFELILKFSFFERIILLIILSFILGKIVFQIGDIITKIARFPFQENKKFFLKSILDSHKKNLAIGLTFVKNDDNLITRPEILDFIGNKIIIKSEWEDFGNEIAFWKCSIGVSLIATIFRHTQYDLLVLGIILISSLFIAIQTISACNEFWDDCAMCVNRKEIINKR